MILLAGALGDRYRRRRIFLVGIAGFTIASIMCAVVPTMSSLIVARILQDIGGPRRSLRSRPQLGQRDQY
ncbi:MFS transporter [Micromonospora sp. U56]|uniref:MFS transporter n=1 Tax=Micromonospora sp. U56 TaxID=2824900 RepID=UPI001B39B732|nr:MFS transporter [Micromonospora sp. U56]MBQ0896903.1 MFS transporter [Micromonospora sp. U56]